MNCLFQQKQKVLFVIIMIIVGLIKILNIQDQDLKGRNPNF